jgi:GNAT superfamily N-acetyltransferase
MAKKPEQSRIELRPLARSDWPTVEKLFGPNGASGGCWCMWWRRKGGKAWQACKGEPNRTDFRALVESGGAHGILAYAEGEPVGWCNIGPRDDFPRIVNSRVLQRASQVRRWSIACFYIRSAWRRRGVAQLLLEAAVAEAFRRGAEEVEGYPKAYPSAATAPAAFVWTGLPRMFEAAGFEPVPAEGSERSIYVKCRVAGASSHRISMSRVRRRRLMPNKA